MQEIADKKIIVSDRIRLFAEGAGYNQYRFAQKTGISTQTLSKIWAGQKILYSDTLEKLANAFPDLNIRWILTGKGEMLVNGAGRVGGGVSSGIDERLSNVQKLIQCVLEVSIFLITMGGFDAILPVKI